MTDSGSDTATDSGTSTRERLVAAGLQVYDELPLSKVLAGATTATVAAEAGVTTGSFFHHFANAAEFADAVALSFLEPPSDLSETVDELVGSLQHLDLLDVIRTALTDTWQLWVADEGIARRFRGQMMLWSHHTQPLHRPSDGCDSVGDVLRQVLLTRQAESANGWRTLLAATDRTLADPFDLDRVATALTALFHGLVIRHAVDPDAVDDELFGDVTAALAMTITVPLGGRLRDADLDQPLFDESRMSPQARSGARRRRETRSRITEAVTGAFGAGWEDVSISEVAELGRVSPQTVINLFSSVRAVAASTFLRHTADIRSVANDAIDMDPVDALRAVLTRLAECVSADPEPARALLSERLAVLLHRGSELADMDIRVEVPLADSLILHLSRMDLDGRQPTDLAATLINFVIVQTLGRPHQEPLTAELALRLLPEASTTGGTHGRAARRPAPDPGPSDR